MADIVGAEPRCAAVGGAAADTVAGARVEVVSPAADPTDLLIDETDALEIGVLLRVVDLDSFPGLSAVAGFQDGGAIGVLQRHEADLGGEKLDLPTPFAARKSDAGILQPVFPGPTAISGEQHDRFSIG